MKNLRITAWLSTVLCLAAAGTLLTSYAQQDTPVKSGAAKLYRQNCASCHGAGGEGSDACCAMMSGPNLLSAVLRMDAKAFRDEVHHVGETNMCAGHLLDLSSAGVEAVAEHIRHLAGVTAASNVPMYAQPARDVIREAGDAGQIDATEADELLSILKSPSAPQFEPSELLQIVRNHVNDSRWLTATIKKLL